MTRPPPPDRHSALTRRSPRPYTRLRGRRPTIPAMGGRRRFRRRLLGQRRHGLRRAPVDRLLQLLAGLEADDALRRHVDAVAGPGVAAPVRPAAPETERAEAAQFHLVPVAQRLDDAAEQGVDDDRPCCFVRSAAWATCSTSAAFVSLPPATGWRRCRRSIPASLSRLPQFGGCISPHRRRGSGGAVRRRGSGGAVRRRAARRRPEYVHIASRSSRRPARPQCRQSRPSTAAEATAAAAIRVELVERGSPVRVRPSLLRTARWSSDTCKETRAHALRSAPVSSMRGSGSAKWPTCLLMPAAPHPGRRDGKHASRWRFGGVCSAKIVERDSPVRTMTSLSRITRLAMHTSLRCPAVRNRVGGGAGTQTRGRRKACRWPRYRIGVPWVSKSSRCNPLPQPLDQAFNDAVVVITAPSLETARQPDAAPHHAHRRARPRNR